MGVFSRFLACFLIPGEYLSEYPIALERLVVVNGKCATSAL